MYFYNTSYYKFKLKLKLHWEIMSKLKKICMNYIKNIQDSEIAENNKNLVDNIVTSLLFLFYSTSKTTKDK